MRSAPRRARGRAAAAARSRWRGSQPRAMDASDQWRRRCVPQGEFEQSCRRSPSRVPARCTSAAAMPPCRRRLQGHWTSSGRTRSRPSPRSCARLPTPAAVTCRSTRRPLPNSAIPTCRPCSPARGDDWSRLIDTYIAVTNRDPARRAGRTRTSACICAAAIAAVTGIPKAVTRRSRSGCSTRSTSRSTFSNTTTPRAGNFTPLRFVPEAQVGGARPRLDQSAGA